ncbi:Dolichyl-diphosphooligosaccharide--protein glycosyltransferase subunit 1 [Pseudozyma hubeiensis]|nr:Dolichyl-diphosphooligosaccharide--protein glycosyltransferase subunit 1 [Pseudozyma hubeiensis]
MAPSIPLISSSTTLLVLISALIAACLPSVHAVALPSSKDWTNTNYIKQIDLTGSTSHSLTTVFIKPNSNPSNAAETTLPYYFILSAHEAHHLSWSRLTVKPALDSQLAATSEFKGGARPVITLENLGEVDGDAEQSHLFEAKIPSDVLGADGATLTLETTLNHVSLPLPSTVKQTDPQLFLWSGDAAIRSPYTTLTGRIKVKAPSPKILSYTPSDATKSGSIVTYGPFSNVAPFQPTSPLTPASVHYQSDTPHATIVDLQRTAEISHWGDALSITDRILLRNSGPALKGHFSRIEHQMASFYNRGSGTALSSLSFTLPAGVRNPWFIDQIGNVSTSRFRPSPPDPALVTSSVGVPASNSVASKMSLLELQPRFPLLGGWNYSFSIGYTLPLSSGWTKRILGSDDYVTAVPLFTPLKDVATDSVSTTIVLPEGATRISIELPFEMDNVDNGITKTYLDTVGRPSIRVEKSRCSPEHAQLVYVKYTLTHRANMIKVAAVAAVAGLLLVGTAVVQRVETKIR